MTRQLATILLTLASLTANAGNKIHYYFNKPVDNTVATTIDAVYLGSSMGDTIAAYINRAKYTIDVAVYNYEGSAPSIATAINNAYGRGVQIRWIYDGSSSNSGLPLLNAAINTLGSPTSGSYGIMHNKFMVIDAYSADANDATVLSGSFNWNATQFGTDYNNAVIIQDSALAHAYTDEFDHMWGGTTLSPNLTASKFGPDKSDLGRHHFVVEGHDIELYFSPSDGTNAQIQTAISSANTDMYFGLYTFTDNSDANMLVSRYNSGVYVAGINDNFSNSYSPFTTLSAGLGSNFKVYSGAGIYHNKFLIVDPSDKCSDPLVLTGSHNWSTAANTKNDENTLIIHSDTAANVYYQAFRKNFTTIGGTLSTITGCPTSTPVYTTIAESINIYPNPAAQVINISCSFPQKENVDITLYNMLGQQVSSITGGNITQAAGSHSYSCTVNNSGIYLIHFNVGNERIVKKIVVVNN